MGMPTKDTDRVFTIDELGQYLKVSKSTLYKLAQEGKLPGQKVGRHWRFRKEAVDRWLDSAAARRRWK
jgi:excisionase family DNA binding protein